MKSVDDKKSYNTDVIDYDNKQKGKEKNIEINQTTHNIELENPVLLKTVSEKENSSDNISAEKEIIETESKNDASTSDNIPPLDDDSFLKLPIEIEYFNTPIDPKAPSSSMSKFGRKMIIYYDSVVDLTYLIKD
jgi:hypothetical protein